MLRITNAAGVAGAKSYFTESLDRGDYYTEGQELAGRWGGKAAAELGLTGEVSQKDFFALCENRNPQTGEGLTLRTKTNRRVGYDINFHVPKDVSVVYALTEDRDILTAFEDAVGKTMELIEENIQCRVRKNGAQEDRVTGNLAWSMFVHQTARPVGGIPCPHLHAHCLTFNATHDPVEQVWKAGQFGNVKKDGEFYETAFHTELRRGLEAAGYETEEDGRYFRLKGSPDGLRDKNSARKKQVEAEAAKKGISDAKQKDGLGARTREAKKKAATMSDLRPEWRGRLDAEELRFVESCKGKPRGRGVAVSENAAKRLEPDRARKNEGQSRAAKDSRSLPISRVVDGAPGTRAERKAAKKAAEFAKAHIFERDSVVSEKKFFNTAMRQAQTAASPRQVLAACEELDLLRSEVDGRPMVTTKEALAQEKAMLDFAKKGKGRYAPYSAAFDAKQTTLSEAQARAATGILTSRDQVTVVRGGAGTGKTYMMQAVAGEIEARKKKLFAFAPSTDAVQVLHDDGFKDANTVQRLLVDPNRQKAIKGQVVWIDEAGQLGSRGLGELFKLTEKQKARVILSGDDRQHGSVERGGPFGLLRKSGVRSVELEDIRRQKGDYKAIVKNIADGYRQKAFGQLVKAGWVTKAPQQEAHRLIAKEVARSARKPRSQQPLVVAPTHKEKDSLTETIREHLREAKALRGKERSITRFDALHLTEAEKKEAKRYERGQVICFHKATRGFRAGDRTEVIGHDPFGNVLVKGITRTKPGVNRKSRKNVVGKPSKTVWPELKSTVEYKLNKQPKEKTRTSLLPTALKLEDADRYEVYQKKQLALASGDKVRITRNGKTADGKHSLRNGAEHEVAGFVPVTGDIKLSNGWVVKNNFGHVDHGYVKTSFASQGKTVSRILVAQSSESFGASNAEQFYVSVSRAKNSVQIYTDDIQGLSDRIDKVEKLKNAHDAVKDRNQTLPAPQLGKSEDERRREQDRDR